MLKQLFNGSLMPDFSRSFEISKQPFNSSGSKCSSSIYNFQFFLYGMLNKKASWSSNWIVYLVNCPLNILSLIALVSETVFSTLIFAICSIFELLYGICILTAGLLISLNKKFLTYSSQSSSVCAEADSWHCVWCDLHYFGCVQQPFRLSELSDYVIRL